MYSAVPYAAFTLLAIIAGIVADLLRKKYLSTVVVRKIFNTSGIYNREGVGNDGKKETLVTACMLSP